MAEIRRMRPDDREAVEYVCRMTAGELSRSNETVGKTVSTMYSSYYACESWEDCFVVVDGNDKAVGYVLCEPDFKRYRKLYRKKYVPKIYELEKRSGILAYLFPIPYSFFGKKYPAHLHIDILPEYQHCGHGSTLINSLLAHLREKGVRGVMLIMDADNTGAGIFYRKLGFSQVLSVGGGTIMAKSL